MNVILSEAQERNMTTGRHVLRDFSCKNCEEVLGWKYDKAFEPSELYKEGKFVMEAALIQTVASGI